jgi:hydroxymethylpyrimidine/phosphomethylpyrimidine kinase
LGLFAEISCISDSFVIKVSSISKPHRNPSDPAGKPLVALAVAGFDPSSGAGITADLKVFAAHGIYGLAAITALTVQSTQGVGRIEPVSLEILRQTFDCLAEDLEISGLKIGMLATEGVVGSVSSFLAKCNIPKEKIVLDPVLRSSSGRELLSREGLIRLKSDLLPLVGWAAPNIAELAILTESPVPGRDAVPDAAARLAAEYPTLNVVVTGGHLNPPDDFLRIADGSGQWFPGQRVETTATHGTGCAFSSALLARLLAGDSPIEAVGAAKAYVVEAMKAARPIGKGRGPMHHLFGLD